MNEEDIKQLLSIMGGLMFSIHAERRFALSQMRDLDLLSANLVDLIKRVAPDMLANQENNTPEC